MLSSMEQFMKVNLKIIKCTVMAVLFKQMATVTKVNSKGTRSTVKVNLYLQNQVEYKKGFG